MPIIDDDDDRKGAFERTYDPELVRHDVRLREDAFDRFYELALDQDIKRAWLELAFKARLESHMKVVQELLRGQQLAEPEPRQKPGPKATVFERVKAEMCETIREHGIECLRGMKLELMKEIYNASPSTCHRAKHAVLSELS
jgi:hypothetical protein